MRLTTQFKYDLQEKGEMLFFLLLFISVAISLGGFTQMIVLSLYTREGPLADKDSLFILAFMGFVVLIIVNLLVLIANGLIDLKNYMLEKENNDIKK